MKNLAGLPQMTCFHHLKILRFRNYVKSFFEKLIFHFKAKTLLVCKQFALGLCFDRTIAGTILIASKRFAILMLNFTAQSNACS